MRLSFAVPILAGLLLGWVAVAEADAPPAAPIFYCPNPGKADLAPAATPAKCPAQTVRAGTHRHHGGPITRTAAEHHRWHGRHATSKALASEDVSASQAFIYRYERAMHGFDPRAAHEAWAEGRHPPCPHHCPDRDGWRHAGPDRDHDLAQNAPVPHVDERPLPPPLPAPPPPQVHAYAWHDDDSGYRAEERERESQRAGGWSYREVDGHGRYQHWGDRFDGEPGGDGHSDDAGDHDRDHHWAEGPQRCPPPVPASACTAGQDPAPRHADVAVAGRDADGYLTWPGKTEQ